MTCSTYIPCPRLYDGFLLTSCRAVQNEDCPDDCRYNEHRRPFWERQKIAEKKYTKPRYDELYVRGIEWLDSL